MSIRPVKRATQAVPTLEGAGVKLRRAFGFGDTAETDPFLLFDDFRNEHPEDYRRASRGTRTADRDDHVRAGRERRSWGTASETPDRWVQVTSSG
ncbi:MAG: hypothetical protein R3E97_14960 [Candidatus Eisenbacteria bacterium]